MKWMKFKIKTITDAEDIIISTLYDIGLEGAQIEDKVPLTAAEKEQMFVDILPDGPEDDGIAYLSFFVEEKEDGSLEVCGEKKTPDQIMKEVTSELEELRTFMDIGEGSVSVDETEDIDWINNWKKFFSSFYLDDILIKPTWEELKPEDEGKVMIEIDPGISFGTGKHETTQLCIRQLRKYMKDGDRVLDVGCGSGILSIVALKLGAGSVVGTDIDEACLTSTYENFEVNHMARELGTFYCGNLIDDTGLQETVGGGYDIVVANILADVIIPMAPVIPERMKAGGIFITSGIIDFKEKEVAAAIEAAGLTIVEINHQGEWVNITARKN